jgi:hypothetical protein
VLCVNAELLADEEIAEDKVAEAVKLDDEVDCTVDVELAILELREDMLAVLRLVVPISELLELDAAVELEEELGIAELEIDVELNTIELLELVVGVVCIVLGLLELVDNVLDMLDVLDVIVGRPLVLYSIKLLELLVELVRPAMLVELILLKLEDPGNVEDEVKLMEPEVVPVG